MVHQSEDGVAHCGLCEEENRQQALPAKFLLRRTWLCFCFRALGPGVAFDKRGLQRMRSLEELQSEPPASLELAGEI